MVTTEEILEAIKEGLSAASASSSGHIETDDDAYEDLRNATSQELVDAAIWFYHQSSVLKPDYRWLVRFIRLGFRLAQPRGWMHIAPTWLRESRRLAALDQ